MQPPASQPVIHNIFQVSLLQWRANYRASKAAAQPGAGEAPPATPARQPRVPARRSRVRR